MALQQTAGEFRNKFSLPVIGVTGSSGKTTTKDMIAAVLGCKIRVLKTAGNLNNEIGLPLTIFQLETSHQAAVLEMGMSAPGEIMTLARIARPGIGVITNIGEAHLEQLGSLQAVAGAKGELLDYLGREGTAVLNGDDPRLREMGSRFPGKVYYYGFAGRDICCIEHIRQGEKSFFRVRFPDRREGEFEMAFPGRHLISNALAAISIGWLFNIEPPEMRAALAGGQISRGRLEISSMKTGARVIDDSYNANPSSMRASLQVLGELAAGKGVAVLGDMLELGTAALEAHREVGRYAAECGLHKIIAVGDMAREIARGAREKGAVAEAYESNEEAVQALKMLSLDEGWYILIKGSRGAQMEKIVQELSGYSEGDRS